MPHLIRHGAGMGEGRQGRQEEEDQDGHSIAPLAE